MTEFYKVVNDNTIDGFGTNGSDTVTAITSAEYNALVAMFADRPMAPSGYVYVIQDYPRKWVLVEQPSNDDDEEVEDKAEAYDILIGEAE